jgi:hypothetical protein
MTDIDYSKGYNKDTQSSATYTNAEHIDDVNTKSHASVTQSEETTIPIAPTVSSNNQSQFIDIETGGGGQENGNHNGLVTSTVIDTASMHPLAAFAYYRSRGVKILAGIDLVVCAITILVLILNGYSFWPLYISGLLILSGYVGAKNYNNCNLALYLVYLFFQVIGFSSLAFTSSEGNDVLVYSLFAIIEIFIFQYVFKLTRIINIIHPGDLNTLRDGWRPEVIVIQWY